MAASIPAIELHFPDPSGQPDLLDLASGILDEIGVVAVHEIGPDQAPVWRVFVANPAGHARAEARLHAALGPRGVAVQPVSVEDEDWAARSQADLRRVAVGRLVVAPPWDLPPEPGGEARTIVIQPSMGFGTGHHETTRLCLLLLQQVRLAGRRVLDVGTGSGVLALAAARLGATDVEGIDCDEDALAAARDNIVLNRLEDRVRLRAADLRDAALDPADVVVANLTGALLVARAAGLAALLSPGGTLVASGFLEDEVPAVLEAFAGRLSTPALVREGDWGAFQADART